MQCNHESSVPGQLWSRRVSQWFCDHCWKLEEPLADSSTNCSVVGDLRWARLLHAPKPARVVVACSVSWSDLSVSHVEGFTKSRTQKLWDEVLPHIRPHQSTCPTPVRLEEFFNALAASSSFQQCWASQQRGPLILPVPFIIDLLSLPDVLHGLAASPSTSCKSCESALTLTDGQDFRCPISLPPVRTMEELLEILQFGTIFLNTASLHWKVAAEICLAASAAFQFPTNINVYITGPGRKISTDVHTDNHDVLVLQTHGAKRWQIFSPPTRSDDHPLYRGKNGDKLDEHELGKPLLDVVLRAGDVLFVPMGFPHFTSTEGTRWAGASVHLTLGISTADYGFCLGGLKSALLEHIGRPGEEVEMSSKEWWRLLSPVPVGFLAPIGLRHPRSCLEFLQHLEAELGESATLKKCPSQVPETVQKFLCQRLVQQVQAVKMQAEAYAEVALGSDGPFYGVGPLGTQSSYRRAMLLHQLAENERKRDVTNATDPRFVKRIDPQDGIARTIAETRQHYSAKGASLQAVDHYWKHCCESIYPNDQPPDDLIGELLSASEHCGELLNFLRRRTPHLRSDTPFASHAVADHAVWRPVSTCSVSQSSM